MKVFDFGIKIIKKYIQCLCTEHDLKFTGLCGLARPPEENIYFFRKLRESNYVPRQAKTFLFGGFMKSVNLLAFRNKSINNGVIYLYSRLNLRQAFDMFFHQIIDASSRYCSPAILYRKLNMINLGSLNSYTKQKLKLLNDIK